MEGIINDKVKAYVESLIRIPELKDLEEYARENYVPIVHKDAAEFLRFFVALTTPERILELGTAIGYSALLMAMASPLSSIVSVDRDETMQTLAKANIERFGLDHRIALVLSDCLDYLETTRETFDLIFIDAGKSHYQEYLEWSLQRLKNGGTILCDNVLYRGLVAEETVARKHRTNVVRLQEFMQHVHQREDLRVSTLTIGDGMLLIRRKE
ncbi:O-methyltransferase [Proteiniclasticum sp. BAD-10]|uniref:tRNA 5-hydroxyuridine methyltransferase n=1 Tax=Proteiniclasticum sediminis TaxID=2804028 RepID=A0A941CMW2_9CLOT|nr:O-methyltransferase [Proteiniclasticum sediminis]